MHKYHDFMIPVERALPANDTMVVARVEDDSIVRTMYDNGFALEGVKSWVWLPKETCECHSLRWKKKSKKSGRCLKCKTLWKKT